jgi:hypothetical protein
MDFVVDNYRAPDGSRYTGTLKDGLPAGLGTCVWPNGAQYDGEWRRGLMHGFGTYVWPTGQRYDGEWKVLTGCARGLLFVCGCLVWTHNNKQRMRGTC